MSVVGIDIGGTFTDVVVVDQADGSTFTVNHKVPTDREDPARGAVRGLKGALERLEKEGAGRKPSKIERIVHGTTVATNGILEREGARIGLLATAGFEDTLFIGRQKRSRMYDLFLDPETPDFLCSRDRVRGVGGRVAASGVEIEPLDLAGVESAVEELVTRHEIDSLAVCLLFSFLNPSHEQKIAELVAARWPEIDVSISAEIDPRFREYERTVVTAFDAYIRPMVTHYIERLESELRAGGIDCGLELMESHGGAVAARSVMTRAIGTAMSGPAAGVLGAAQVGKMTGVDDLVGFDVGGTSADVALIRGNDPVLTEEGSVGKYPLRQPMIEMTTIGSGGGSIASVDRGKRLRVGPESAGSTPGPVSYGLGGSKPTITDASVVMGFLGGGGLAGGSISLDSGKAEEAVFENVAKPLDVDVCAAAWGMHEIANAAMADAIRLLTVQKGLDPRRFAIVPFGGAGATHACYVAEQLGISRVIVPPAPGVLSAYGLLVADVQAQAWGSVSKRLGDLAPEGLRSELDRLLAACSERLILAGGDPEMAKVAVTAELRFVGQAHELKVQFSDVSDFLAVYAELDNQFRAAYSEVYGYIDEEREVELVSLRVSQRMESTKPPLTRPGKDGVNSAAANGNPAESTRDVYLPKEGKICPVPVLSRDSIRKSHKGPLIVEQEDTTLVVPPGWTLNLADPFLELSREPDETNNTGNESAGVTATAALGSE